MLSPILPLVVHQPAFRSAVTPVGFVHKSMGDNVVRMWVQLKILCVSVKKGGIVVMDVIWHRLCVSMI